MVLPVLSTAYPLHSTSKGDPSQKESKHTTRGIKSSPKVRISDASTKRGKELLAGGDINEQRTQGVQRWELEGSDLSRSTENGRGHKSEGETHDRLWADPK